MTTYYKKLDNIILPVLSDTNKIKGDLLFHYGFIRYYKIIDSDYLKSLSESFKIPPKKIFLTECTGPLLPHHDNGVDSCINFYIRTGDYTTSFWIPKENAKKRKSKKYNAETNRYDEVELGYMYEDLIFADSFNAKDGDVYILNNGEIHSIEGLNSGLPRAFIQLQWNFKMDELIEKLGF